MPILATAAFLAGWAMGSNCPGALLATNTTVGAISNSNALSICVSKAQLISGTNGSLTLVIGGGSTNAPRCLIYPNGLSPDLTLQLLQSGHVGCWSLYPPGQPITIVNVGIPPSSRIQSVLKTFKPDVPRILINGKGPFVIGDLIPISSTAAVKVSQSKLLGLPLQVRFKPATYSWLVLPSQDAYPNPKISWKARAAGSVQVNLAVAYSVEYEFTGITSWRRVQPNISMSASPVSLVISEIPKVPQKPKEIPRLVGGPCQIGSFAWGC